MGVELQQSLLLPWEDQLVISGELLRSNDVFLFFLPPSLFSHFFFFMTSLLVVYSSQDRISNAVVINKAYISMAQQIVVGPAATQGSFLVRSD